MTEGLFRRALASVPAIRRGLEALEAVARSGGRDALARATGLPREAAGVAEDAADALELLAESARAREAEQRGQTPGGWAERQKGRGLSGCRQHFASALPTSACRC